MKTSIAIHRAALGLTACLSIAACNASSVARNTDDIAWLKRTLAAQEAALSRAYDTCNLHALRDRLFAGTSIETPDGQRIDPVIEARDRFCGRLHRQVLPGSLTVRAVGDDSALVVGMQRFCPIGADSCAELGSRFAQLWTLDRGHWRMGWMRRFDDPH